MKTTKCLLVTLAAVIAIGCDEKKTAINVKKEATKDAIDMRKADVDAFAKEATRRTDANATIDKAMIQADNASMQAQLAADKKKVDADAEAEKAAVDAEKK